MSLSVRDEPHQTPFDAPTRTTQELSVHQTEHDAAMRADRSQLQRQAILRLRTPRVVAALGIALLVAAYGRTVPLIGVVTAILAAYLGVSLTIAAAVARAPAEARHDGAAIALLAADAVMASWLCALAPGVDGAQCLLLLGALMVPTTALSLGRRFAVIAAVLMGLGYLATSAAVALHDVGAPPHVGSTVLGLVVFAAINTVLIRALGDFRDRMDELRGYCKLGELGETALSIPGNVTRESDDLALLGRSFEAMRSRLADQIGSDPLTGCANRRMLEKRLLADWRFAKRRGSRVAVTAIDIDHFKQINDTRGHPVGDLVLQQLASIMLATARDTDTVARLGGDEFVIVLPDTDWQGATTFAERLRHRVMEYTFGAPGTTLAITISVGVAIGDGSASMRPDALLEEADRSLYRAKTEGRNRVSA